MDKTGEDWDGLYLGKFEKCRPTFFQIYGTSAYIWTCIDQYFINTAEKSLSVVKWPRFCKWKTLGLPIWRLELIISKIKHNYQKECDLAPLKIDFSFSCICPVIDVRQLLKSKDGDNKSLTINLVKVSYSWSALLTVVKVTSKNSFVQKLKG